MKKVIIFGSSKGIGKSIKEKLSLLDLKLVLPTSKEVNTSNIDSMIKFARSEKSTDILILNTGGPPAMNFFEIKRDLWIKFFNQLFLGFVVLLQNLKIKKNGYVFLISSHTIQAPENNLTISNSMRIAFLSIFKTLSNLYAKDRICFINIAPGPFKTKRLEYLVKDLKKFESQMPMNMIGKPEEIGDFVKSVIKNNIKYISGVTIRFDGGLSKNIF